MNHVPVQTSRPSRAGSVVAAGVVLLLTLSGCALELSADDEPDALPSPTLSPSPLSPPRDGDPPSAALADYYAQKVDWQECRDDAECATVKVPLDYDDPNSNSIELSVLRVPAKSPSQRVGSLVVNPGGPGGSGVDYAATASSYFGPELLQAFDVVGFDPRGVGESTPIQCLSDEELDEFVAADPDPETPAEVREGNDLLQEFGQGCVAESGKLASHISTVEAAKDIDIIRAVVGDPKLNFFGASYGTFLGATYADLFPKRVGRMVLDGAIDPSLSSKEMGLVQAKGFEVALRAYVGACVDRGDCFLGDSVDAGTQRIRAFLDEVDANPIEGSGDRPLTVGHAVLGIWAPLYNEQYWPLLDAALADALDGDGRQLLTLSDAYTSRGSSGYLDNSMEALYAVNCLDHDDAVAPSRVEELIPAFEKVSPTFGAIFAFGLAGCSQWPIHTGREPAPIKAEGAAPILVIGTTRDPATPLEWAEALASQLSSGVLIRRDGDGHTGYNAGNPCVDNAVEAYLVSGRTPRSTLNC